MMSPIAPQPQSEAAARFTCPIAPSVNNLFINRTNGRSRGALYRRWQKDAGWAVKLQAPKPIKGIVAILIEAPLHRRRDVDNAIKPTLDLLVSLGLIDNDNWIDDLRIVRVAGGDEMVISIWPLGEKRRGAGAGKTVQEQVDSNPG